MESNQLSTGDTILITGPTTGVIQTTVSELRLDDAAVPKVSKGDLFSMPLNDKIRPSDKLFKVLDLHDTNWTTAK